MAKQQPVALVFAGPVSRGTLGRLPGLRQRLIWVKSSSIPTASRAVHALGCGHAVAKYSDLRSAATVLVSVPDSLLHTVVEELAQSDLSWPRRNVILYDSGYDSTALEPLRFMGAETASLTYHARPEQFLAEGTTEAVKYLRCLTGQKVLIHLQSVEEYQRGMRLTTEEFFPLFASAMESFVNAGMTRAQAESTTALMIAESARSWLRAGKRLLKKRKVKQRA